MPFKIKITCSTCGGTGKKSGLDGSGEIDCVICEGEGELVVATFKLKEIEDKLDEILSKLET